MEHQTKMGGQRRLVLEEILNEKQIHHVLKQVIGDTPWDLKWSEVRPAVDGIAGFLGDHMKAVLYVDVLGEIKKVHLFVKRIPENNKPKADFIDEFNFYRREMLMFKVLEEIPKEGPNPWCGKAYIYSESIFVMPDLAVQGYTTRHYLDTLDTQHIFITTTTIARFHAAFVNYETKKSIMLNRPYNTLQEYGHLLVESTFCDSPWMNPCAKLSTSLIKAFSSKPYRDMPDMEEKLRKLFLKGCYSLKEYEDTVNVLVHKDLWVNNIMFKYENDTPVNAVLVDYQALRYGPPAFDLMIFLYVTTDRHFRDTKEKDVFNHYYTVFEESLTDDSKKRMEGLGFDRDNFLEWCERARMFGMVEAIGIYPFILMDPKTAQKEFDDPATYEKYMYEDRSEPVLAYSMKCNVYRDRNLEASEEFVERYVLKEL
ncbi:uncharacterized protein LOC142977908 [Anticarsia gemmatalis]|uniref:uncharacterized protein LOC142977908 n=1 Tax=Anticarsia gemmatalis TaxID=129554 RepID=UPI003F7665E9